MIHAHKLIQKHLGEGSRDEYVSGVRTYRCLLTISTTHDRREHPQGEAQSRLGQKKSVRSPGEI